MKKPAKKSEAEKAILSMARALRRVGAFSKKQRKRLNELLSGEKSV